MRRVDSPALLPLPLTVVASGPPPLSEEFDNLGRRYEVARVVDSCLDLALADQIDQPEPPMTRDGAPEV